MAKRQRKSKKWISWLIVLALLIGAGAVCYLVWDGYFKDEEPAEVTEEDLEEELLEEQNNEEVIEEPIKKEEVIQYEGGNPNEFDDITGVVTYAGVSGNDLMVRVNIDQYLNSGECMLLLSTAGNIVYSNVARVIDSASTATCEGFNVPTYLLESGHYNITVEVTSGDKKGAINGEVNL